MENNQEIQVTMDDDDTNKVEVEIVDDTPEEDKGRPLAATETDDPSEEELAQYSASVRKRIDALTFAKHDERRKREAETRQREEALRYAQAVAQENQRLKQQLEAGSTVANEQAETLAKAELEAAKDALRKALSEADADKVIEAQEKLGEAQYRLREVRANKQPLQQTQEPVSVAPVQPQQPVADPKAYAWWSRNPWFRQDAKKTAVALEVDKELREKGVVPNTDEYYEAVDKEMRKYFPDLAGAKPAKPTSVVAPGTRTASSPNKVRLTQSQVAIAKRLGVPLEMYAAQVAKMEK